MPKGMLLHGRGIGEDRPQITGEIEGDMYTSATYTQHLDLPLVEGNVFVLKPGAMPGDAPDSIRCGDTVVIEKSAPAAWARRKFIVSRNHRELFAIGENANINLNIC